ncbi:MAG: LysR family transcriptional regulator [Planctomycetota bacterium]|nr:LysR family transcriptional regulator [Planctomycetota bacterium]
MQLRFVEIFCAVVEERSFSKGARAHNVTQSSASQTVSNLERQLGAKLIDRSQRPLELTPAGKIYYDGCRQLLAEYRAIEDRVRGVNSRVIGPVRVAAIYSVGLLQMERFIRRFEEQYPDVVLRLEYLQPNQVYEQVLSDQADLGLVSYARARGELGCIAWQEQPMALVVSPAHRLASARSVLPAQLEGEAFVAFITDLPIRREIDKWLRKNKVTVDLALEFDNIETIKKAVECGSGVAILPQPTVWQEVASGALVAIPLAGESLTRPLGIIHKKNRHLSAAVRKFEELLRLELGTGTVTIPESGGPHATDPHVTDPHLNGPHLTGGPGQPAGPVAASLDAASGGAANALPARRPTRRKRV